MWSCIILAAVIMQHFADHLQNLLAEELLVGQL
jgi:hypothetical protein